VSNRTFWCGCHRRVMCPVGANVADGTLFLARAAFRFDSSMLSGSVCGYTYSNRFEWLAYPLDSRCPDLTRSGYQSRGQGTLFYLQYTSNSISPCPTTLRGQKLSQSPEDLNGRRQGCPGDNMGASRFEIRFPLKECTPCDSRSCNVNASSTPGPSQPPAILWIPLTPGF